LIPAEILVKKNDTLGCEKKFNGRARNIFGYCRAINVLGHGRAIFFCHGRDRNIFGYCRAINIIGHGSFYTCLQLALLAIWATWTLGNFSFG
jgi:hypothetical protein